MAGEAELPRFLLEADCEDKIEIFCMNSVDFATISHFLTPKSVEFQKPVSYFLSPQ